MKDCTYYDLLGVSMDADEKEIADAKNFLVKKLHPDANIDSRFDTTSYIQNVLTAYRILSNPDSRRVYDRRIRNPVRRETQAERAREREAMGARPLSPNFAPYWEAADRLNGLVSESAPLLKQKKFSRQEPDAEKLAAIAEEAHPRILVLQDGEIPRRYWFSHAMNWLLFQWSQNRDLPYPLLYSMYDSYLEQRKSALEKRKIANQNTLFLHNLDRLISYRQLRS
ncbi:J domain-containing protein [Mordavella massiliensis]|uniref:J domain-containing protein n=1 Tax=Mordavella massiliensis TaxID=1871024 RepID=A0A939BGK2_9CLOT|nr:J domain-containing protein [Mordavella massiliensis]MBM6948160.1 J domain-containing protein [Mordavella massiliensis]